MRQKLFSGTGITGLLMVLLGLVLGIGGAILLRLGGSAYYLIAGLGLMLSGAFMIARRRLAFWIYAAVLLVTLLWSLAEVGLDGWALVPRLVAPAVLGLWIAMPWVAGRLGIPEPAWTVTRWLGAGVCALLVLLVFAAGWATTALRWDRHGDIAVAGPVAPANPTVADGDWQYYGRTADGNRYSPLAQITPQNVGSLQVAWRFNSGDLPQSGENAHGHEFNFEATPIKIDDTTYFCTPHRDIVALDAVTGRQRWRFHPQNDTKANIYLACRGVAYFAAADAQAPCAQRIISTTADARLFALDARTGALCTGFGQNGYVDLRQGMGNVPPASISSARNL
jgi:quinoprotein glucose dehydrogenase